MGDYHGMEDWYYEGRRPTGIYIPRFRNLGDAASKQGYIRGFGYQGYAEREGWMYTGLTEDGFGKSFKEKLLRPGKWAFWLGAWGETLPYADNRVTLDTTQTDKWGLPLAKVAFSIRDNEKAMRKDMQHSAAEMLEKSGFSNVSGFDYNYVGGECVHEMGTARMGRDPKTSVLNGNNQLHEVKNVFITDGSCMTSSACQNPSLTYMALTARACDFAVRELKKGNL
jgi:choline dehydrogenase-like flavoprotein